MLGGGGGHPQLRRRVVHNYTLRIPIHPTIDNRQCVRAQRMNATSLLVSTTRLVLQAEASGTADSGNLSDLYRLVPYLRQSLSCTVCGSLLIEPYTPQATQCQHHVCRSCLGGRKSLKPTCHSCRDYQKYEVCTICWIYSKEKTNKIMIHWGRGF